MAEKLTTNCCMFQIHDHNIKKICRVDEAEK
jgi:hypothetical protein